MAGKDLPEIIQLYFEAMENAPPVVSRDGSFRTLPSASPTTPGGTRRRPELSTDAALHETMPASSPSGTRSRPDLPAGSADARYPPGTRVLVQRSSGEWSDATVEGYDAALGVWLVALTGGGRKRVALSMMALPPSEDVEESKLRSAPVTI